ncbi:ExbD/TolR family protein [Lysobacter tyrosinilyticus]
MATSMFAGDTGRGTAGRAMAEMNITPLVDVMLVLLIIFMVAAPLATRQLDLRLPQNTPPQPNAIKPPHLSLSVLGDGQFALDGAVLSEQALGAALSTAARREPNSIVDVTVSEAADYQAFTTALATTRHSGLSNIALQ